MKATTVREKENIRTANPTPDSQTQTHVLAKTSSIQVLTEGRCLRWHRWWHVCPDWFGPKRHPRRRRCIRWSCAGIVHPWTSISPECHLQCQRRVTWVEGCQYRDAYRHLPMNTLPGRCICFLTVGRVSPVMDKRSTSSMAVLSARRRITMWRSPSFTGWSVLRISASSPFRRSAYSM